MTTWLGYLGAVALVLAGASFNSTAEVPGAPAAGAPTAAAAPALPTAVPAHAVVPSGEAGNKPTPPAGGCGAP